MMLGRRSMAFPLLSIGTSDYAARPPRPGLPRLRDAAQRQHAAVRDTAEDRARRRAPRALRGAPRDGPPPAAAGVLRGRRGRVGPRSPGPAAARRARPRG